LIAHRIGEFKYLGAQAKYLQQSFIVALLIATVIPVRDVSHPLASMVLKRYSSELEMPSYTSSSTIKKSLAQYFHSVRI